MDKFIVNVQDGNPAVFQLQTEKGVLMSIVADLLAETDLQEQLTPDHEVESAEPGIGMPSSFLQRSFPLGMYFVSVTEDFVR